MDLTRRTFLGAMGALTLLPSSAARAASGDARNLIIVFARGGWDPTYVFDAKPDSPFADTGVGDWAAFGNDALWLDPGRPSVTDFFDRYGALTSVVNGMNVPSVAHPGCMQRVLTGSRDKARPDIGAIIGHEIGSDSPMPYLDVGGGARPGIYGADLGYVGRNNQLSGLVLESEASAPAVRRDWERYFHSADEGELIRQHIAARTARNEASALGANATLRDAFLLGLDRSHLLPDYADFFRNIGGGRTFADQARVAAEAIAIGLSRTAFIEADVSFDTHTGNTDQIGLYEETFAGLLTLMDLLETTPSFQGGNLVDDTVVLVLSEMGRTPVLNSDSGKDHWPFTSCVVTGPGVKGHQVVGATSETLVSEAVDHDTGRISASGAPLQSESVLAGIAELFGVSPDAYFPDAEVFRAFHA